MFTQLLTQPPIALNAAKPGLTFAPAVAEVVMKGLAKQPAGRFASTIEFGDALRAAASAPGPGSRRAAPAAPGAGGVFARVKGLFGKS